MKIDFVGMILSHFPNGFFERLVKRDDVTLLNEEDAVHTMIMEYAKVANGGESSYMSVDKKYLRGKND